MFSDDIIDTSVAPLISYEGDKVYPKCFIREQIQQISSIRLVAIASQLSSFSPFSAIYGSNINSVL